jgi:hypothetical protein
MRARLFLRLAAALSGARAAASRARASLAAAWRNAAPESAARTARQTKKARALQNDMATRASLGRTAAAGRRRAVRVTARARLRLRSAALDAGCTGAMRARARRTPARAGEQPRLVLAAASERTGAHASALRAARARNANGAGALGEMTDDEATRFPVRIIFARAMASLDVLPEELLGLCLAPCAAAELCALAQVSRRYRCAALSDALWLPLLTAAFGAPSALARRAAARAGGWFALYADMARSAKAARPWSVPAPLVLSAFMDDALAAGSRAGLALLFLVDGRRARARACGSSCANGPHWRHPSGLLTSPRSTLACAQRLCDGRGL